MKFILDHKKKLATALLAIVVAVVSVLRVVPGDQKEDAIQKVHDTVKPYVDKLPDDAAPAAAPAAQ